MPMEWSCNCDACTERMTPEERKELHERITEREQTDRERLRQRVAERERLLSEVVTCNACPEERERRIMLEVGDGLYYCEDCADNCSRCERSFMSDELHEVPATYRRASVRMCGDCTDECYACESRFATRDMYQIGGENYCEGCADYCDRCDTRFYGECEECQNRVRGLSGYGTTYAERWLGGPLPKDKTGVERGYYLGFELEISASSGSVSPILQWADQNLGYDDALDCKEDSSVDGFEIATQPMTPDFFEQVKWESLFDLLNNEFPLSGSREPTGHGLHVHIGRVAFARDDIALAAFCYLIGQDDHLERIGRRAPTTYCKRVEKPVSTAIKRANQDTGKHHKQAMKSSIRNLYPDRDAINLQNHRTIEIRAFRSTRNADELRDAVRLVYVAAEYVRMLRFGGRHVSPRSLQWGAFCAWVAVNYPDAFMSIAGLRDKKRIKG